MKPASVNKGEADDIHSPLVAARSRSNSSEDSSRFPDLAVAKFCEAEILRPTSRACAASETAQFASFGICKKRRLKIQYGNDIAMSIYTRSMLRFGDDSVKACWSHLETKRSFSIASGSKVLERQLFDFLRANFQDGYIGS